MKVVIDPRAGYCSGVNRVIELAERHLGQGQTVHALGEIIHNRVENRRLQADGLRTVFHDVLSAPKLLPPNSRILIRAHGEPPESYRKIRENGFQLIDGTCPVVVRSQKLAQKFASNGYLIVIVGKKNHPEVLAVAGNCMDSFRIISSADEVRDLPVEKKVAVMVQTTFSEKELNRIIDAISRRGIDYTIGNSICKFISRREDQVREFAGQHDIVLMVGGRNSSNTRVLFENMKAVNPGSYWIETAEEIKPDWLIRCDSVGITGSASTPLQQLESVKSYLIEHLLAESSTLRASRKSSSDM